MPTNLPSQPSTELVEGPAIEPPDQLLAWLETTPGAAGERRRRIQLPVVVRFEDEYRLAVGEAFVGARVEAKRPDALRLALEDTGMSVALLTQLGGLCPKPAEACALWLEGYWGRLVDMPSIPDLPGVGPDGRKPFSVLKVHGRIDPPPPVGAVVHAFVEPPAK